MFGQLKTYAIDVVPLLHLIRSQIKHVLGSIFTTYVIEAEIMVLGIMYTQWAVAKSQHQIEIRYVYT